MAGHAHPVRSPGTLKAYRTQCWRLSAIWLGVAVVLAVIVALRLNLTFDLSAFVPSRSTPQQEVLVEQIRNGPAARLLIIGLGGATEQVLAEVSQNLKGVLSENPAFVSVANGQFDIEAAEMPALVEQYALLLQDIDYSVESLRQTLQSRLRDLALGGGNMLTTIIARDPYLAGFDALEALSGNESGNQLWYADDRNAVLVATTRASSIDIGAQAEAVDAVRLAVAALPSASDLTLDITGVGAFSVELQETIRAEATARSMLASAALMLVIFVAYRSLRRVILAVLPLGLGFLAGLAAVSLLFDPIHGITLAFGFTMLGVAIDYPLHLFSHARDRSGTAAMARIWPTLRLGAFSTSIAYLALVFAGSNGLAQLGVFTAAGVLVALLVTRTWLPPLLPAATTGAESVRSPAISPVLAFAPALVVLLAAVIIGWPAAGQSLWNDNVSSLSPAPEDRLAADRLLRAAAATPDMRYRLVLFDESLESLLERCEQVERWLSELRTDTVLEAWQAPCQLLPSARTQRARQASIPGPEELRQRLGIAVAGTPFRELAFEPFVQRAAATRSAALLTRDDFSGTVLGDWLDTHLLELDSGWSALFSLTNPDAVALTAALDASNLNVELIDMQAATMSLMRDYRHKAMTVIGIAGLLILSLLWYRRRAFGSPLWIGLTVVAALALAVAVTAQIHGSLTVMHLIALILVLGLGLDHALFLSRSESLDERSNTRSGVLLCAVSTTLVFGILAASSIPVLQYLGMTVAVGSAASYLLASFGSRGYRVNSMASDVPSDNGNRPR